MVDLQRLIVRPDVEPEGDLDGHEDERADVGAHGDAGDCLMAVKLGLIGDSNTDAYRGTDNRGGSYSAVTFNWAELLVMLRGVDLGAWSAYSEPRRTDYARNW